MGIFNFFNKNKNTTDENFYIQYHDTICNYEKELITLNAERVSSETLAIEKQIHICKIVIDKFKDLEVFCSSRTVVEYNILVIIGYIVIMAEILTFLL